MQRNPSIIPVLVWLLPLAVQTGRLAAQTGDLGPPQAQARVDALLGRMTLEEKVGQLNQISPDSTTGPKQAVENADELIRNGSVGGMLNAVTARETNGLQREAVEGSRMHIPILFGLDVIHGFRTLFPIPLGLSASWDPALVGQTARYAAQEASSQGVRWVFSPMVDIARDPRWGRIAEGAGEDPYLGSAFARAYVRGYQGESLDNPTSVIACAKHFVGYGAAEGGRDYNTTEISERTLRETYLPPFHAAVDEGAGSISSRAPSTSSGTEPRKAGATTTRPRFRNARFGKPTCRPFMPLWTRARDRSHRVRQALRRVRSRGRRARLQHDRDFGTHASGNLPAALSCRCGRGRGIDLIACAKHFVGYGAAEGGRDYNTTEISERTLRETYLPPFHAAVDEGAGSISSRAPSTSSGTEPRKAGATTTRPRFRNARFGKPTCRPFMPLWTRARDR